MAKITTEEKLKREIDIIQSKIVTTVIELLEQEMIRLHKEREGHFMSEGDWIRKDFGENIDTITPSAIKHFPQFCQICGKKFRLEDRFMRLTFSFCKEYNCHMNICRRCLLSMSSEV